MQQYTRSRVVLLNCRCPFYGVPEYGSFIILKAGIHREFRALQTLHDVFDKVFDSFHVKAHESFAFYLERVHFALVCYGYTPVLYIAGSNAMFFIACY
jgi:hypothetical protein